MVPEPVHFVFSLRSRAHASIRRAMRMEWDKSHMGYVSAFLQGSGGTSCAPLEPCRTQQEQTKVVPFTQSVFK